MTTGTISTLNRVRSNQQSLSSQKVEANKTYQWTEDVFPLAGYKPVGIVGWYTGTNSTNFTIYVSRLWNNDTQIQFGLRNETNVDATVAPSVNVLYAKI